MSLILCRQEPVTIPYEVEELGLRLWSSQELSYVIYHHPLLVMEDFVCERLIGFIRSQLRMPFLAEKLEKWIEGRGFSDELLFLILQDCYYITPQEQAQYRQQVTVLRKLPEEEFQKRRADYFYQLRLYGKAAAMYERILERGKEKQLSGPMRGLIYQNIAACYAKLFCYEKALHAYENALSADPAGEKEYVKRMFLLSGLEPELEIKEKYLEAVSEEEKAQWQEEADAAFAEAAESDSVKKITELFEKDPVKRLAGASEFVNRYKVEYRRMI